ncbi:MAG TPA: hypothetical protein VHI14_11645 [Jatrophihabitantaceae bacterium]|jgi:hypothetical protein|nr:hypothetical protein [Jatrophihabitantaceae bacterium]
MADIQFPNVLLGPGTFDAQILDNNGAPTTVLEASQPFTVHCDWSITALAALLLGGEWQVAAYVEAIGPGPEQEIGEVTVPLTGATNYSADIFVAANTLPDNPAPPFSGAYKVVVLLTHRNFGLVSDVAGVVDGPVVRIG